MNIVKSTLNKVQELEKRLDNALLGEGLRVSEIKQDFENEDVLDSEKSYKVLTINGGGTPEEVVIQGEIKFRVHQATNITVSLMLDGYVVYSEIRTVNAGLYSWAMIKAMHIAQDLSQELYLTIHLSGGGSASLLRYNFFLWGYGESVTLGEIATEPSLYATSENDRYNIYLTLNGLCYKSFIWDFPENLSIDDFSYFGAVKMVVPVQLRVNDISLMLDYGDIGDTGTKEEEDSRTIPTVYNFIIDTAGNLFMTTGENETFVSDGVEPIDADVASVTATLVEDGTIAVVYSKSKEIYTFTVADGVVGEISFIRAFDELIEEVSLIQNCTLTTFLVVGLESGKNYLISSTTTVRSQDKRSLIVSSTSLEFL